MGMPRDLVLVRHGQSEGNVANDRSKHGDHDAFTKEFRARHSSTWRLTTKGQRQAKMAGTWIREQIGIDFDRRYVSEYIRAQETAGLLDLTGDWLPDFYLRERDWGELDVMSHEERKRRFGDTLRRRATDSFFWRPPNGESMAELCMRIDRVLNTLHRECDGKRVIIVCHGEVMWAFRVRLERMTQERWHQLDHSHVPKDRINNCQILHYTRQDPQTGEVTPHLNHLRSVCPTDLSLSTNDWQRIVRPRFSSGDLLARVSHVTRMIDEE